MPTYDYICRKCQHQYERFQSITAEPEKICPVCGKSSVERLISGGVGLSFKGSGFYITDYKASSSGENKTSSKKDNSETS